MSIVCCNLFFKWAKQILKFYYLFFNKTTIRKKNYFLVIIFKKIYTFMFNFFFIEILTQHLNKSHTRPPFRRFLFIFVWFFLSISVLFNLANGNGQQFRSRPKRSTNWVSAFFNSDECKWVKDRCMQNGIEWKPDWLQCCPVLFWSNEVFLNVLRMTTAQWFVTQNFWK